MRKEIYIEDIYIKEISINALFNIIDTIRYYLIFHRLFFMLNMFDFLNSYY